MENNLFFELIGKNQDVVGYDENTLEYTIDDNGRYIFGPWAGNSCNEANAFHEMCHFVELNIKRISSRPKMSWGFDYGSIKTHENGKLFQKASTIEGAKREARVWAYQANLMRHYGFEPKLEQWVCNALYLNCWPQWKNYCESVEESIIRLARYSESLQDKYSFTKFKKRWDDRIKALRNTPFKNFKV